MRVSSFPVPGAVLGFLLLFMIYPTPLTGIELILNTHHTESVSSVFHHTEIDRYVSSSHDGTIRLWTPGRFISQRTYQITNGSIERAIPHPGKPQAATLIRRQNGSYALSVIDLRNGDSVFNIELEDRPIHFAYSPQGSYLAYSLPRWDSMFVHEANRGRLLNYLRSADGIMSFFTFSRSEANIMTYQGSTGEITYYDVRRGSELSKLNSSDGISHPTMLSTRFLIGARAGKLVAIDVVNGRTAASLHIAAPIEDISVDTATNTIGVVTRRNNRTHLLEYVYAGGSFIPRAAEIPSLPDNIREAAYSDQGLLIANADNQLSWHHRSQPVFREFSAASLRPIEDIAFTDGSIHFVSGEGIVSVISDLFGRSLRRGLRINSIGEALHTPPRNRGNGIAALNNNEVLIWPSEASGNLSLYRWTPGQDEFTTTPIEINTPIREAHITDESIMLLTRQGNIHRFRADNLERTFDFRTVDLQTVTEMNQYIVAGKSRSSGFQSPLLQINPSTMETVPVDDPSKLVFDLEYDSNKSRLFSLSLISNERSGESETVLRVHPEDDLGTARVISRADGEDLTASLYYDSNRDRLYTSLGGDGIAYWNGRSMIQLEDSGGIPRRISGIGDLIWATNTDGSVGFWQADNGVYIGKLALMDNNDWVFITPQGGFLSSADFDTGRGLTLAETPNAPADLIEQYRVQIPYP